VDAKGALSEQVASNTHWTQEIERNLRRELDEKNQGGPPYVSAMDVRRLLDELYRTTEYAMKLEAETEDWQERFSLLADTEARLRAELREARRDG
jgi:hypothetical protein